MKFRSADSRAVRGLLVDQRNKRYHKQTRDKFLSEAATDEFSLLLFRVKYADEPQLYNLIVKWRAIVKELSVRNNWLPHVKPEKVAAVSLNSFLNDMCLTCHGKGNIGPVVCPECHGNATLPYALPDKYRYMKDYFIQAVNILGEYERIGGKRAISYLHTKFKFSVRGRLCSPNIRGTMMLLQTICYTFEADLFA